MSTNVNANSVNDSMCNGDKKCKTGRDTSFLLISIAVVNLFAAFLKLNNTNIANFVISDSGFVLPVVILMLTSVDVLKTFKGIKIDICAGSASFFAVLSLLCSGIIIACECCIFGKVFVVNDDGYIEIVGNIVNYLCGSNVILFNKAYLLIGYFVSALFQFISGLFKVFYNKKQK